MYPFLEELSEKAGGSHLLLPQRRPAQPALPRPASTWAPKTWPATSANSPKGGLINIAGGCCGNTPEDIAAIAKALEGQPPRKWGANTPTHNGSRA